MTRLCALSAALAVVAPTPLAAQALAAQAPEQTLDGAMQFLRTVTENGTVKIEIATPLVGLNRSGYNQRVVTKATITNRPVMQGRLNVYTGTEDVPAFVVTSATRTGECKLDLSFTTPKTMDSEDSSLEYGEVGSWRKSFFYIPPRNPFTLEFKKVSGATSPSDAVVRLTGADMQFVAPDKDMAARLTYVVEFIRQRCDPAASTGF